MKTTPILAGATALVALFATVPAFAQQEIATGANAAGITSINEDMKDVEDDVRDSFDRSGDAYRWGPGDQRQGLFGSVALTYSGETGNNEGQDFALAGRLSYNQGQFAQSVGILLQYGEDDDGDKDKENTYVIYEAQYYINDRVYAFALGRLSTDGMADDFENDTVEDALDKDGRSKRDALLAFGPGYRIINNEATAWRVQAGVGVRYTKVVNVEEVPGGIAYDYDSDTSVSYIVSSRFYHKFNDNFFLTNDTDYLSSDANDVITNELGLNFKMSDAFATRVSYITEYQSDRAIRTDNTLGVSLVYGF